MIEAQALTKIFRSRADEVRALDDVSFTIDEAQFYVLLGPSGSGKTTAIRSLAGLEDPDRGSISIDGDVVVDAETSTYVPSEFRPIGMVFQSYALWPHMDVAGNVCLPLKHGVRGVDRTEMERRLKRVVRVLHLDGLESRPVSALSGGQQQRVALARALALEPKVLLMDEPLSNLDAKLRAELRVEIRNLTRSLGITTVYVTHDQAEAMVMGDVVSVMNAGRILQEGAPEDVYRNPTELFVAQFLGEINTFHGRVVGRGADGRVDVETEAGVFQARARGDIGASGEVVLCIRIEDIVLDDLPTASNVLTITVADERYMGENYVYELRRGDITFTVKRGAYQRLGLGDSVGLHLPADRLFAYPRPQLDALVTEDDADDSGLATPFVSTG